MVCWLFAGSSSFELRRKHLQNGRKIVKGKGRGTNGLSCRFTSSEEKERRMGFGFCLVVDIWFAGDGFSGVEQ